MKNKFKISVLIVLFGLLSVQTALAGTENAEAYLAEIDGEIKAGTLQYLKRAVREAEKAGAEYLIIKLDTPGGLLKSTKDIVDLFSAAEVKTVVFVHKEGGWAYSAGTFILLAADFAFVHPAASIGACQPQELFGQAEAGEKMIEGTVSWIKSLAEARGKNPEIAEKFVRENLTLTGREAEAAGGIINGAAGNLDEVFLKLGISGPKTTEIRPTAIERFFDFLSHPYLISLFLTLGGLGLVFAFRSGEFELTGFLGVILLFIGLWGMGVITFNILGVVFLVLGIFLLILEIFQPGFGVFGFLGIISLVFGIFTLEGEPFLRPQIFEAVTMAVLGAVLAVGVLFVVIGRGALRAFKAKPKTGAEALLGLEAEVVKELGPIGQVLLRNEIWQAESADGETIPKGEKVKIVKIEGNTLFVGRVII